MESIFFEHVNVAEVSGHAVEVETETKYEFLGYAETDIVGADITLECFWLEEQCGDLDFGGILGLEVVDEACDGIAGVYDVLDNDHCAALDVLV